MSLAELPPTPKFAGQATGPHQLGQLGQLVETRLRGKRPRVVVTAQHAEQASHLGECVAPRCSTSGSIARAVGCVVSSRGAAGLHDHHADAVGDDVLQLAADTIRSSAIAARSRSARSADGWRSSAANASARPVAPRTTRPTPTGREKNGSIARRRPPGAPSGALSCDR